jgi:PAS domain S-box-containing protein
MEDKQKTTAQLIQELEATRKRLLELEEAEKSHRRVAKEVQQREETLRIFIESSTIGIWCFRVKEPIDINLPEEQMIEKFFQSICSECNETYAKMRGTTKKDILGVQLSTVMPNSSENRAYLAAFIRNGFKLSGGISHEIDIQGGERYFSNSLVGIIKEEKLIEGWGTQTDITEQVKAERAVEESKALLQSTIESLPFDFFALDMDGRYMLQNSVCRRHWGNIIGKRPEDLPVDEKNIKIWLDNNRRAYGGEVVDKEVELMLNGEKRFYHNIISPIQQGEKIIGILGVNLDITERMKAENALRENEQKYRALFEEANDAIFLETLDGQILDVNRKACELLGYKRDELLRLSVKDIVESQTSATLTKIIEEEKLYGGIRIETKNVRKDGTLVPVEVSTSLLTWPEQPLVLAFVHDITERKEAVAKLRESEERFRSVAQTASDAIITVNREGDIVFWNNAAAKIFGHSADEMVGKPLTFIIPERFRNSHLKFLQQAASRGNSKRIDKTVEFYGLKKDGSEFPVELSLAAWRPAEGIYFTGIVRDITERKMAEEALRESEEKYRNLIDQSNDVIYLLYEGKFEIVNKRFEELLGYSQGETNVQNFNFMNLVAPRSRHLIEERAKRVTSGELVPPQYEFTALTKEGREIDVETSVSYVQYKGGIASQGILRDISERKKMEDSLRIERDKLKKILDHMNDEVIMEDKTYTIIYQNRKSIQSVGSKIGSKCYEVFHHQKEPCQVNHCAVKRLLQESEGQPYMYHQTYTDGRSWDTFAIPITDEKKERVVLEIARDVSEQETLRTQLMQSEKMSALGQLISGVAHELNNPLTGILGYSQLLLMSSDLPDKTKQSLETINHEAERARKIVQNLLTFARQRKPEKKLAHINDVVGRTLDLRAYEMRVSNIDIIRHFDQNCPPLLVDEHQLQQVFMNLIINAEQAMLDAHGKGRLEVTTKWIAERKVIQISFHDDGPGIVEEYHTKIFDPFFTTKPIGKGTGLGLSISYGIVQEHGGLISVTSTQGHGTSFTVELPYTYLRKPKMEGTTQYDESKTYIGRKRLLVIDDEDSVLDLVKDTLQEEGYEVETALDGASALEKIHSGDFDAVLSDLKMPGKNGIDIYLYCKREKPDLSKRFLFLTGDVGTSDSLDFIEDHHLPYVSKPFNLENLISSVSRLFQAKA